MESWYAVNDASGKLHVVPGSEDGQHTYEACECRAKITLQFCHGCHEVHVTVNHNERN